MTSELTIVRDQICNLYLVQEKVPIINDVNIFNLNNAEIGEKTNKFTHSTYVEVYKEMLDGKKYNILLYDESIISMHYQFNTEMKIIKHSLSFIPSIGSDIDTAQELSLEHQIRISKMTNNYIRIDYNSLGKKDIIHTDVHMHYGIFFEEKKREIAELRIPFEGVIYPNEFMYIVLKYIYALENDVIDFLLDVAYSKEHRLEACEMDKLILTFNRNSFS